MKKIGLIFGALVVMAIVLLVLSSRSGLSLGGASISSPDGKQVEQYSLKFLEDIKFKDFERAASYHSREDRKSVNIPSLIERMFGIKPEFLDILRYDIQKIEIDSTGTRARVKTHTVVKILNTKEIKEPEIMLYYRKDPAEGWVMELESSLR